MFTDTMNQPCPHCGLSDVEDCTNDYCPMADPLEQDLIELYDEEGNPLEVRFDD